MRSRLLGSRLILIISFILIFNSCKKEEVPTLTTSATSNILGTSASSGGTITSEGTGTVLSRGVCWSTGTTPTISDSKTQDGAGAGSYTSNLTELNAATKYYIRAYATNDVGTGHGMAMSFTTLGQSPTSASTAATNITVTSATLNGSVNANYLSTIVTFEYGTTTSYGSTATATQSPISGNSITNSSVVITGLTAGTIYHFRLKAVNSLGTTYGSDLTFTTLGQIPSATTLGPTNVSTTSASVNGSVNANYLSSTVTFEYGTTINYGNSISATQSPVTGNTVSNVSVNITGLISGTIYHYRVKAINSLGTSYGVDLTFKTLGQVPTVITLSASNITTTGATLNGSVNSNYLSTVVTFDYGTSTSYGSFETATQSPVTGNTPTNVSVSLTGLIEGTTYHFRVKAENILGTTYGSDITFIPILSNTVGDIDGNVYNIITIGTQVWMKENLKTTKYNDGTIIPNIIDNTAWASLTTGAYCDYSNNPANSTTYGRLYNWYSVDNNSATKVLSNGGKNVCPTGWHVPSDAEWTTLTSFLGGEDVAGGKLKENGTTHWAAPNSGATNETNFTALPGGYRYRTGWFDIIGFGGNWWSSTNASAPSAWYRDMQHNSPSVGRYDVEKYGFSIRCLKD